MKRIIKFGFLTIALAQIAGCASIQDNKSTSIEKVEAPVQQAQNQEDKYLWLEEVEGEKALNWVKGQNDRSLAKLQSDVRYKKFEDEAMAMVKAKDRLTFGGFADGYVSNFWQSDTQIHGVWRRAKFDNWKTGNPEWESIIDFDELSKAEDKNWVYKGSDCLNSRDMWNTICLMSLSNGGKDANIKREYDIKTRKFVDNGFVIPEAKSDTTWIDKDTILLGTDWGKDSLTESGYPFIVKTLKRGQKLEDAKEVFRGEKTDVSAGAYRVEDSPNHYEYFFYRSPTFFTNITFYQKPNGEIVKLDLPQKKSIIGLRDGKLYVNLNEDWTPRGTSQVFKQGSLIETSLAQVADNVGKIDAKVIYTPQSREAIQSASLVKSGIIVNLSKNVKSEIRFYQKSGNDWQYSTIDLPKNGVAGISDLDNFTDQIFYSYNDFITPPSIYMAQTQAQKPQIIQSQPARFDANDLVVEQLEATSKDGTKVPYFVVHKKNIKFDGSTPTLLYGYGGFEVSMLPNYSPYIGKMWLERGGAYVLANIRGGGEFGPAWHDAGLKTKRQVVYDDFIGVAEDLIKRKITSPRRLGIMGGSNGGLLMGVMLTQRPELFNAVVVQVPLLDMLRYHKLLAGASWVDEYGSPEIVTERAWLEKLSPYQNLQKRKDFPVPLIVTSTKDDRVHPGHARKYGAKMEELGMPFLYYENINGGHSAAANLVEGAKRRALEFTYLSEKLMD